ncbi:MAG: hypothetical protein GF418_05910 [Chitinivibrionales bacterium]|nr:hypothetical protein [Chitinivibrionales bacterium]MBD3395146.1 hypothetical protein [Chitinivibrionales bacterium]
MSPTSSEAARHYAEFQVQTASHPKRICMLHVRLVELVMLAGEGESEARKRILLDKAQNILSQLQGALRVEDAISQSLFYLYDYCYVLLQRGEDVDLKNVLEIVVTLRKTFDELLRTIR